MIVWFMVRSTCFTVTFTVLEDATTGMYALRLVLVAVRVALTSTNGDGDFVRDCLAAIIELDEDGTLLGSLGRGDEAMVEDFVSDVLVLEDGCRLRGCNEVSDGVVVTTLVGAL